MKPLALKVLEDSLYKNSKMVSNFNNISESRSKYLLSLVDEFKEKKLSSNIKNNYYITIQELKKPKYRVVSLEYLEKYNLIISSYEELYFFLINTLDPNCEIYTYYLQNYNKNIKKDLEDKYGFYNRDFLTLEKKYNSSLLNNFIFGIKKDYSQMLMLLTVCNLNFEISKERINEIKTLANTLKKIDKTVNKYEGINSCIFNALNQKDYLGLINESEIMLFIIFYIDPNFTLLQIYEDECNIIAIEKRSKKEIGIYYKTFIDIERYLVYTNKVDITIDTWSNNTKKKLH